MTPQPPQDASAASPQEQPRPYYGCGDSMCVFGVPDGQHTNGGCRCFKSLDDPQKVTRLRRATMQLRSDLKALRQHIEDEASDYAALNEEANALRTENETLRAKAALAELLTSQESPPFGAGIVLIQHRFGDVDVKLHEKGEPCRICALTPPETEKEQQG